MHISQKSPTFSPASFMRLLLLVAITLCVFLWYTDSQLMLGLSHRLEQLCEDQSTFSLVVIGVCYSLLLAIPFVPGIELGILIMTLFGKTGIVFAYLCTVAGLSLAYFSGWVLCRNQMSGEKFCSSGFDVQRIVKNISVTRLKEGFLQRLMDRLMAYRYLSLGILFNLPGNMVIGGGGGIAMMSGAADTIQWKRFLITVAIATSPVPMLLYLGINLFE